MKHQSKQSYYLRLHWDQRLVAPHACPNGHKKVGVTASKDFIFYCYAEHAWFDIRGVWIKNQEEWLM